MKKVVIIGSSGAGKTYLGKVLSVQLDIPVTDLDDLFWLPNWTQRPREEFEALIKQTVAKQSWIICGNQSKVQHLFWPEADTVIWLDLPLHLLLWRILSRGMRQMKSHERFCNGNQQSIKQLNWLVWWLFSSFSRRRRKFQALKGKNWVHLKTAVEVENFIQSLKEG